MNQDDLQPTAAFSLSTFSDPTLPEDIRVTYAGHEVIYSGPILTGDYRGIDIRSSYRGKVRHFFLVFQPQAVGPAGIYVHNGPDGITLAFNRWGGPEETVLDPPLRFADLDGQRFELSLVLKRIQELNCISLQIVAVPSNYAGPWTRPLYGADQPIEAKIT